LNVGFTTIDVPGATATVTHGINNSGQIVGWFQDATGARHGFLATPVVPDTTPPTLTVSASPATLSPPNGKLVDVLVSGTITDEPEGSVVESAAYTVIDEYGQVQPKGSVTLVDGSYAFTVELQASRNGNDRDGRRYTIEVSATDVAGNQDSASATVTVPRN
jgi:probable HAF family extracellular repeat protein